MPAQTLATAAPHRILSIDVLRGITIAFMILVNDPGDSRHTYEQLEHARWNGFTLTDLVFPTFLFLVGASVILSLSNRIARSSNGAFGNASSTLDRPSATSNSTSGTKGNNTRLKLARNILRRSATILLLDLLLAALPYFHLSTLRIYGVLTRIALCYLVVGLLCLVTQRARTLLFTAIALLVGYWALMRFVPVPGFGLPTHDIPLLDPDRNLVAWLDRAVNAFLQRTLHTGHLYERTRDPEGLLSTLPAIATTLLGALTALWLRRPVPSTSTTSLSSRPDPERAQPAEGAVEGPASPSPDPNRVPHSSQSHRDGWDIERSSTAPATFQKLTSDASRLHIHTQYQTLRGLLLASAVCLVLGRLWNLTFPINKNLWTSSYVLFAGGLSLLGLALCFYLVDILRLQHRSHLTRALLWPWLVFGSNAITAYAMSNLFVKLFIVIRVHDSWNPNPASRTTAWGWIYNHLFARGHSTNNTSLAFALTFVALCFLPNLLLWRKRIFLKV